MKNVLLLASMLMCSSAAYADANNPADMEKYIQQCPAAVSDREVMKDINSRMHSIPTEKTGDENQDLLNQCKVITLMKSEYFPGLSRYVKDLDQCASSGFPILKSQVANGRMTLQLIQQQMQQLNGVCN